MKANQNKDSVGSRPLEIPDRHFFRIGDVAELLGVKPYVLRYWESEFKIVRPGKSTSGQRVYRKSDVQSLAFIKQLLYSERYSIEGARRRIQELKKDGQLEENRNPSPAVLIDSDIIQGIEGIIRLGKSPIRELFKF